jgi:hypothetical protein
MSKLHFRPLGNNSAELGVGEWLVLISYETPVAVCNQRNHHIFVTSSKFSNTTTKHINKWVDGRSAACISQDRIEEIANGSYGPSKD